MNSYPPEAYSPSGHPWWEIRTWPGKSNQKFGTEPRLAAYLRFNAEIGGILTLRKLRQALGEPNRPNDHEHFNRRFRQLRKYGWIVLSSRDVAGLKQDEYRLDRIGSPIWLGKSQFTKKVVSAKVRRQVFDRDGRRCVICGIGAREPYPDEPTKHARLTLGHFVADSLRGPNDLANLRTECSRCNEPAKEEATRSESAAEIWPKIRSLARVDKARLLSWMQQGHRDRDTVDCLFDQYRSLPAPQRDDVRTKLMQAVRGDTATRAH
jgi:hypothetical protein